MHRELDTDLAGCERPQERPHYPSHAVRRTWPEYVPAVAFALIVFGALVSAIAVVLWVR